MRESTATRKAALWVGVVFLLGAALGAVLGYGFGHHSVAAASAPAPQPEPVRRAQRVQELTHDLELTSAQAQEVDSILLQRHTEAKNVHDQSDAQLEQIRQKGRDQIRAILTPEQKPKFEEFLKNLDEQKKHSGSK
jgi:Spy/CpxP family protein refolding chaperone